MVVYGPYQDMYDIFLKQFRKNWPNCPYPLVIGNQYYPINDDRIITLDFDENVTGTERIKHIINMTDADYYLGFEVDRVVMESVNSKVVEDILDFMDAQDIQYFRCNASINKKKSKDVYQNYPHFYHIPANEPYGVPGSTVIWRKDLRVSRFGTELENGYTWEAYHNNRAALSTEKWVDHFATADSNVFHILHCIEKKKWIRKSKNVLEKAGFDFSDNNRDTQTIGETITAGIKEKFKHIPGKTRYRIKKVLKKFGMKFSTDY